MDTISYADATITTHTYNNLDQLTARQDSAGTTTFAYDAAGRLISLTDPHGFIIEYDYDEAGNVTELTYPGSKKVFYNYTNLNQLQSV
ncbi:MAG: RHS repeat protein [Deltaproteobacteria bacterium]|nr:RHS repeat protein [Deltaproteobacteria bacterium]